MRSKKQKQGMVSELSKKELTAIFGGANKTEGYITILDGKIVIVKRS